MIEQAMAKALWWHKGQRRKSGDPYIFHPFRVMLRVKQRGARAMVLAILHDTVEDTEAALKDIEFYFGEDIMVGVSLLTHAKGEPYEEYIQALLDSNDADAIAVKIADIEDNTRPDSGYKMSGNYRQRRMKDGMRLQARLEELE